MRHFHICNITVAFRPLNTEPSFTFRRRVLMHHWRLRTIGTMKLPRLPRSLGTTFTSVDASASNTTIRDERDKMDSVSLV